MTGCWLLLGCLWCALVLSGCTSLQSLVSTLQQHQVPSCLSYEGYVYSPMVGQGIGSFRGLAVTGGASMEDCTKGDLWKR